MKCSLIIVMCLLPLISCEQDLPMLDQVTHIVVTNNQNVTLKEIRDPETIRRTLVFAKERRSGWYQPSYGIPVPATIANFYAGEKFVGHMGVGTNFFETQQSGDFFIRSANATERTEFLKILGLTAE